MTQNVKVIVRNRPLNQRQKDLNCKNIISTDLKSNQIILKKPGLKSAEKYFAYDKVFDQQATQNQVYEQTAFKLVNSVIQGYNATIFAYGQTGCGKTYTMMGNIQDEDNKGIIPRTFNHIITILGSQKDKKHLVQCSFIEIYNQEIHDLLSKDIKAKKQLKQSSQKGVYIKDIIQKLVKSTAQLQKCMEIGYKNRAVRETAMNKQSSRSHSIFTISIQSSEIEEHGNQKFKAAKLNLVDLAGSQRQSKTQASGTGLKQATKINLSLSALGNVISALVDGKSQHVPYRDSKLTRLLQDSLGGNTKTLMIAVVSPADYNYEQTISTLRYASRAKFIQNKPIINEDPKDALLRQYAQQIKKLKKILEQRKDPFFIYSTSEEGSLQNDPDKIWRKKLDSQTQILKLQQQEKQKLKSQLENLQKLVSKEQIESDKAQLNKIVELQQKLKKQQLKEQKYKQEKLKRQSQLLNIQQNYKSLNDEVDQIRTRFLQMKEKYLENLQEIKDLQEEHERDREQLLDTIRSFEGQISKWTGIINMILTQEQINRIIQFSEFIQQSRQWIIAPFYYRDKDVNFPLLPANKTRELIQNQRQKKQIIFKQQAKKLQKLKLQNTVISSLSHKALQPVTSRQSIQKYPKMNLSKHISQTQQYQTPRRNGRKLPDFQEISKIKLDPVQIRQQILKQLSEQKKKKHKPK